MAYSLGNHPLGYNLSASQKALNMLTLTNIPYAIRHGQLAIGSQSDHWFGHIVLAIVECIPVIGLVASAIECLAHSFFTMQNSDVELDGVADNLHPDVPSDPSDMEPVQPFAFTKLPPDIASHVQNFLTARETVKTMQRTCKSYQHLWGNDGHLDLSDVTNIGVEDIFRIIMEYQAKGRRIISINLNGQYLTHRMLELLSNLTTLTHLDLSDTNVDNDDLSSLAHLPLETLNLSRTQVTDEGLAHLEKMPLKVLNLVHINITDAGLAHLARLPLEQLSLNANRGITGNGFAHFTHLPLRRLNIANCPYVTDNNLAHLIPIKSQLESLDLSGTTITDNGLAQLAPFELSRLKLDNCPHITDLGQAQVAGLPFSVAV